MVLVEAGDLAVGTSSRSGKTMHGGLGYLEQLNFSLVFGALRERDLTIRTLARHLVTHEPFRYPITKQWERPYVGAGVGAVRRDGHDEPAHRWGAARPLPGPRSGGREAPGLDAATVIAALQYPDGRMDDARHTLAVVRTAAGYGARVITRAPVVAINRDGSGRVVGVRIRDELTDAEADIAARVVVNAAGVWAAHVQHLAGAMRTVPDPAQRCAEPTALTPCECAPSSLRGSRPCAGSPWPVRGSA